MSAIFTDTATIYNHFNDKWYRTVLEGVQWSEKTEKTVDADGVMHLTPSVSLSVPFRPGYVEWRDFKGDGFTFGLDNLDVVVLGACDKEMTDSYTITNLQKDFKAATVKSVKDNTLRQFLKHWKVVAQ